MPTHISPQASAMLEVSYECSVCMFQDYSIRCKELEREVKTAILDRDNAALKLKVGGAFLLPGNVSTAISMSCNNFNANCQCCCGILFDTLIFIIYSMTSYFY